MISLRACLTWSHLLPVAANVWGLFNLWRGGFFKSYKEQRIRAEAALLESKAALASLSSTEQRVIPAPAPASL